MSRGDPGEHYADALSEAVALANRPAFDRHKIHRFLMRNDLILDVQSERGSESADRLAWSLVDKAEKWVEEHPAELWKREVPDRIIRYRADADLLDWRRRTGALERRVLEGAYLTALMARSTAISLSARTWGLRVGVSAITVSRAVKRLRERRLLLPAGSYTLRTAAHYKLRSPRSVTRGLPPRGGSPVTPRKERVHVGVHLLDPRSFQRRLLEHDAFRPQALGDRGWMVARHLSDELPMGNVALSSMLDRLRSLESYGAVCCSDVGWVRVLEPDFFRALDRIALDAGTFGTLDRERRRYQAEREARDRKYPDTNPSALFVTLRDRCAWWSVWWGSLEEVRARAA